MSTNPHVKIVEMAVTDPACLAGTCGHADGTCPETEIAYCSECVLLAETVSAQALEDPAVFALVSWPCATAQALQPLHDALWAVEPEPNYHRAQLLRLERDWPALAAALTRILPAH